MIILFILICTWFFTFIINKIILIIIIMSIYKFKSKIEENILFQSFKDQFNAIFLYKMDNDDIIAVLLAFYSLYKPSSLNYIYSVQLT